LELLQQKFENLKNMSAQKAAQTEAINAAIKAELAANLSRVQSAVVTLNNTANYLSQPVERVATVSFNMSGQCTTSEVSDCSIFSLSGDATQDLCLTPEVPVEQPGKFLLSATCHMEEVPAANQTSETFVATLETTTYEGRQLMRCRCGRFREDADALASTDTSVCIQTETRCAESANFDAMLTRPT
jgi:hypothetical protein